MMNGAFFQWQNNKNSFFELFLDLFLHFSLTDSPNFGFEWLQKAEHL